MQNAKVSIADLKDQRRETIKELWNAVNEQNKWGDTKYRLEELVKLVAVTEKVVMLLDLLFKEIEKPEMEV